MTMLGNDSQSLNAAAPIADKVLGRIMLVNCVKPSNVLSAMLSPEIIVSVCKVVLGIEETSDRGIAASTSIVL